MRPDDPADAPDQEHGGDSLLVHATCVGFAKDEGLVGALLRGPSGVGKSDLALRAIDQGARLVADDQVRVSRFRGALRATPPKRLAGLIEVRGIGLVRMPCAGEVPLVLLVDLLDSTEFPERFPEPESAQLLGISLPLFRLRPHDTSACAKLRLAVDAATGDIITPS